MENLGLSMQERHGSSDRVFHRVPPSLITVELYVILVDVSTNIPLLFSLSNVISFSNEYGILDSESTRKGDAR